MSARPWPEAYVGLPWRALGRDRAGLDCWGLVRLVMIEQRGIELPPWDTVSPGDTARIRGAVDAGLADGPWLAAAPAGVREFDFAMMRGVASGRRGPISADIHFGIVAPGGTVLHMIEDCGAVLQPIAVLRHRISAFHRHRELTTWAPSAN